MRRRPWACRAARCTAGSNGMASKPRHERRVFWLALLGGFPAVALALGLLWFGDYTPRTQWTLTMLVAGVWLACATIVREHVVRPLQTVSNVLAALRERDYTLRARGSNPEDALGLLLLELNSLGDDLRAQRLDALEATALLRRVMEEIDVAIFAFDSTHALRLVNRSGAAGPRAGTAAGPRRIEPRSRRLALRRRTARRYADFSRPRGPLGSATRHVSAGRPAAPAAGAHRRESSAQRRGTTGVEAADPRPEPRAQ